MTVGVKAGEVRGPIIVGARQVWFHGLELANLMHSAACWVAQHHTEEMVQDLLLHTLAVNEEGYTVDPESEGALTQWSLGIVTDGHLPDGRENEGS